MKFMVKQYEFREYILHDIAAQIRLSFNYLIKEPWQYTEKLNNSVGKKDGTPEDKYNFTFTSMKIGQEFLDIHYYMYN